MVSASSSDIQRKVALMNSHSTDPRFPLSAPNGGPHYLLLSGFKQESRGNVKRSALGESYIFDARVETANTRASFSSCSKQVHCHILSK